MQFYHFYKLYIIMFKKQIEIPAMQHCCYKCDDLVLELHCGTFRDDRYLLVSTVHWWDCGWVGD